MSVNQSLASRKYQLCSEQNSISSSNVLDKRHLLQPKVLFVCVEVLRPSQPNGVMLSAVSLPNNMFTGQA